MVFFCFVTLPKGRASQVTSEIPPFGELTKRVEKTRERNGK